VVALYLLKIKRRQAALPALLRRSKAAAE